MAALVLPEYYADLAQTTLSSSYTAASGSIVVTTAANLSTTRQFHFMITDQTTGAVKCIGKATALTSSTFTVTMTTDANANSGDFVTITLCQAAMDQIISDCDQFGTFASLPTSVPPAGRRYKCTDAPYEFISNGSAWQAFYNALPATLPPSAGWTNVNISSTGAVLNYTFGYGYMVPNTSSNSDFISGNYRAAPGSTPYSFTVRMACEPVGLIETIANSGTPGGANFGGFAIGFSDGTKYVMFGIDTSQTNDPYLIISEWATSTSTPSLSIQQVQARNHLMFFGQGGIWFRMRNDGTNLKFFISIDGNTFYQFYTQTITSFLSAATNVVWGVWGHSGGATVCLYDWTQGV